MEKGKKRKSEKEIGKSGKKYLFFRNCDSQFILTIEDDNYIK
jgi:hypothetical protein